jgi:hypothetical protein
MTAASHELQLGREPDAEPAYERLAEFVIAVVIPAHNEEPHIGDVLLSIPDFVRGSASFLL